MGSSLECIVFYIYGIEFTFTSYREQVIRVIPEPVAMLWPGGSVAG